MAEDDASLAMRPILTAYWMSRCIHVAVEFKVPDALGDAPETVEALAAKVGAHAGSLKRVLRAVATVGIFEDLGDGRFAHTPASRTLRADHPNSQRGLAMFAAADYHWAAWGALGEAVKTGRTAFDGLYGCNSFEYYNDHPEDARVFDDAMTSASAPGIAAATSAYDFSGFKRIGDIGGGAGHLIRAVLAKAPAAEGVVFDMPHVAGAAPRVAGERLAFEGGDFFNDDLPVCDAYLMMRIIHDWDDDRSIAILKNLRRAAPPESRLLLVEAVLSDDPKTDWGKITDVEMLVLTGGRERTGEEYRTLLAAAGFEMLRVIPTATSISLVEARPAG